MDWFLVRTVLEMMNRSRIEYVVVGGVCSWLHGVQVRTRDLDILYRKTPQNVDLLISGFNLLKGQWLDRPIPGYSHPLRSKEWHVVVRIKDKLTVDLLSPLDHLTYEDANKEKVMRPLLGISVPVLSVRHLVEGKKWYLKALPNPKHARVLQLIKEKRLH